MQEVQIVEFEHKMTHLIAELNKFQILHTEDQELISELRKQNQQLRLLLEEQGSALKKCIGELGKALKREGREE